MTDPNTAADNDALANIKHIIVVMMENRSFDHYLGYRRLQSWDLTVDGLTGDESNQKSQALADPGADLKVPIAAARSFLPDATVGCITKDPAHLSENMRRQMCADPNHEPAPNEGWPMDGFVQDYQRAYPDENPRVVMSFYDERDVPVHHWVAENFSICDRWFSSVPSWTMPNTFFMLRGEIDRFVKDQKFRGPGAFYFGGGGSLLDVIDDPAIPWTGLRAGSDALRWRCYHSGVSHLAMIHLGLTRAVVPNDPHFVRLENGLELLKSDLSGGSIPSVVFIEPDWVVVPPNQAKANDDHPPANIHLGQVFLKEVLDAVRASPVWKDTLLLIWYDEPGGFYDHVSPVATNEERPLHWTGMRVPVVLMSPWVARKHVVKATLEHSSVFRTIFQRFMPEALADRRVEALRLMRTHHLGCALTSKADLRADVAPVTLPTEWPEEDSQHALRKQDLDETLAWLVGFKTPKDVA